MENFSDEIQRYGPTEDYVANSPSCAERRRIDKPVLLTTASHGINGKIWSP